VKFEELYLKLREQLMVDGLGLKLRDGLEAKVGNDAISERKFFNGL
jgi:hypothetical protein